MMQLVGLLLKEYSLKGMKYIAQRQATLGATPWGRVRIYAYRDT